LREFEARSTEGSSDAVQFFGAASFILPAKGVRQHESKTTESDIPLGQLSKPYSKKKMH
jgi:hypothetical protein